MGESFLSKLLGTYGASRICVAHLAGGIRGNREQTCECMPANLAMELHRFWAVLHSTALSVVDSPNSTSPSSRAGFLR